MKKLIYWLFSRILLRNTILLESSSDFCDSTKTFFDFLILNKYNDKYKIYWAVDDPKKFKEKKYKNVKFISRSKQNLKSLIYLLCCEYCIYTHSFVGNYMNKRQKRVFVTHASMPFKNSSGKFWKADYNTIILGTSSHCIKYRNICLNGDLNQYKITGLPRNDDLFAPDQTIYKKLGIKNKKLIIWMPTFKHQPCGRNDFLDNDRKLDVSLLSEENVELINNYLLQNDATLIIKPHPGQDLKYIKVKECENVLFVTNDKLNEENISLYKLLAISDALITDFSSVFLDYLLLNKPIAFDLCDQQAYKKGIGYIVENPDDYMVGKKIYSLDDLFKFIKTVVKNIDDYNQRRIELCDIIHKYKDNKSSERLAKLLNLTKE